MALTPEQKEIKRAEQAAIQQLLTAQNAEILALKEAGASQDIISAEKKANSQELADAKKLIAQEGSQVANIGIQQALGEGKSFMTSAPSAYSGDTAKFVGDLLARAGANYGNYGIAGRSKSGDTKIGLGLDQLVNYELGKAGKSVTRLLDNAKTYVGQSFTEDALKEAGVKLKPVKGMDNVFQWKTGSGETQNYTFFVKDPTTGALIGTGVNRTYTPEQGGVAGFLNSDLGKVAMVAASIWGAPYVGSLLVSGGAAATTAAAAAAQAAVGSAVISASTTALAGGSFEDVLKNAGIAAASAYAGSSAGAAVPPGYNEAISKAVYGAAQNATSAALSGANIEDITKAGLMGAATGAAGSAIQQFFSPDKISGIEGFAAAADEVGGAGAGQYIPGIEGFALSADEVGGAGAGGPSGVEVFPVGDWGQTGQGGVYGGDAEAQPGGFYGDKSTSGISGIEGFADAADEVGGGIYGPSGVEVIDRSVAYDSSYQEPSTWDSIKQLGSAVYDFAVANPGYVAAITAGAMTLDDLVKDYLTKDQVPTEKPKTKTPVDVKPLTLDIGGASGVTPVTSGGFGGTYETPVFQTGAGAVAPVQVPETFATRPLFGEQAPGSPIMARPGIVGLAAPAATPLSLPVITRPAENVSREGFKAEDIANYLDAQAAARYNASPAVQSGEIPFFGAPVEGAPTAPAEGMKAGGIASLANYGRYGDTMLAHISPDEAVMLKSMGGAGTINPVTGLPEFFNPLKEIKRGFRKVGDIVQDVARPVAKYLPYVAPFIPGLNTMQAAMLSAGVGALGGEKNVDFKRGLMSGLMTYGIGSLAEGLSAAGQPGSPMSLSGTVEGAGKVLSGAPGAKEALASKFGTGTGTAALMGATGVAAIDEQNAFIAEQERQLKEQEERRRLNRERSMQIIGENPIRFSAGDLVTDELGYDMAKGGLAPRFLSGGGDGMSDSIPANIEGKQEARLADGEFVVPADVVSGLGNGSSKAGAKQLYAMMDRVRKARTGTTRQGKEINPRQFMPA